MAVPPEVPIVKFFSPNKADQGLIEFHNSTLAAYQPLDEGAAHPNSREYDGFKLGRQFNLPSDHKWIVRVWVTDETDPTWWNWAEKFSGDANSYPIFIREYREPRKTYAPLTKGQPLKSVYKLSLSTAGSGYEPGTQPALTFTNTGTGGSGAAGHAIVNPDGTIAALVLDDGGDSYNTAPAFTIEAPPSPSTDLLVSGGTQDGVYTRRGTHGGKDYFNLTGQPDDDAAYSIQWGMNPALVPAWVIFDENTNGLYYSISTVATPDLATNWKNFDDDSPADITVALNDVATGTAVIQPATALLVAEEAQQYPDDSEFRGLYLHVVRVYETLPGPLIPDNRDDLVLGPVQRTRQAVLYTGQAAVITASGKTTYEARDGSSIVAWKIVEAWTTGAGTESNPAFPTQQWTEFERDGVKKVITKQLKPIAEIVTDETLTPGQLVREYSQPFNEFLAFQITETITVIDGSLLNQPFYSVSIPNVIPEKLRALIPISTESDIVEGTAESTDLGVGEFERSERQLTPFYKEVRFTVMDIGSLPITITGEKETNAQKQIVTVAMKLCLDSTTPTLPTALIDVDFKKLGNGLAIEITRTIPSVFDGDTRSIEIPDVTPAWARALLPTRNTSSEAAATSVSDPTLSTGQLRKTVKRTTEKTVETQITARDLASLPKTRTNKRLTREFGGGEVDEVETVATGSQSISSGGLLVLDSEMEVQGDGTSVLKTSTQTDGSWPILYDYDIDPETGQTILTSYQVIDPGAAATASSVDGVVTRYKHIDQWRSLEIITTYSTPADYEEQRFGAHNFPALVDITTWSYSDGCGTVIEEFRGGFSAMVEIRTNISFTTTKQTISGLSLIPKSFILGKYVQLPADMLVDGATIVYTGDCTGSLTITGSDPDYSTYVGSIQGTEQLITGESVRTQSGLYRNTEVYVTML